MAIPAVRQTTWAISFHDRQRLRAVVKRVLLANGVPPSMISDYEADKYIDALGPETYERWIKEAVDSKVA